MRPTTTAMVVVFLAFALSPLAELVRPPSFESQLTPELDAVDLGTRIDLNTADSPSLCLLPGLGPPMSDRIIEHRAHAPFAEMRDLRRVNGVGDSILTRIKPYAVVSHVE